MTPKFTGQGPSSELRDRITSLERELKKTQEKVQKDIKFLFETIQKVATRDGQ